MLALPGAMAADGAPRKPGAGKLSMVEKGSFHKVHERKAKTDCEDCHADAPFADNVLLVSRNRPLAKDSPGPVDPKECLDCHIQKSNKLPMYAPR
ncbi:hypothetical protein EGT07_24050 [Herbaspirillum sp. HC18]|nr:hypothetical protein EGT07_24050 [Herbaspirillum sp. HC18]